QASIETVDEAASVYLVRFSREINLPRVIDELSSRVEYIEPNYVITVGSTASWPRDPEFINLWGLNNQGQSAPGGVEGTRKADLDISEAWKTTTGAATVVVGVVDTGIDYNHPDLAANIYTNTAELNGSVGVDDDHNGFIDDIRGWNFVTKERTEIRGGAPGDNDPADGNGHRTHCAGTIAAVKDNHIGVVGVAPSVKIMPLRL